MYTVDLHLKNETVQTALYNLKQAIGLARKTKEHVICLIVGYGSTGGTHKIKTVVVEQLEQLKLTHQVKDYIEGTDIDIFNPKYQNLQGKKWLDSDLQKRRNKGEVFVII